MFRKSKGTRLVSSSLLRFAVRTSVRAGSKSTLKISIKLHIREISN